ncbi:MAG TPA: bacillithiol biosynthesis cysteine-adding enzyme BshC [Terriglobia bacterium]|nr:bacillithiol biosynthesis cysteine-adding enzyme BshC [Terriglobia bacterium]
MASVCIPYTRVPHATALYLDYLYHFDRVERFYGGSPSELHSFQLVAEKIRSRQSSRETLVGVLKRQNQHFGCSEETLANIRLLKDPETFAVLTGQQAGLFSGPAFTLYKALTTVRLAQHLTQQGLRCVPVFWLATEDHDLEEVLRAAVFDEDGRLEWLEPPAERPAANSPVGMVKFGEGIIEVLARLQQLLPPGEPSARLLRDLRECYAPGMKWGDAFGRFMTRLFGRFGVILIDPLDADLHGEARGIYRWALGEAASLRQRLLDRSKELIAAGYHAQVHVGTDSTLLFASVNGGRQAIRQQGDQFAADALPAAPAVQVEQWITERPLDFTPNALLRPVVQDSLLPTVAYVPGPAELAYFAQSQVIYEEIERPIPVMFPRAAFTLADRRVERLLGKYALNLEDVWRGEEHLRRKIAAAALTGNGQESWPARLDRGEQDLRRLFEDIQGDVERLDPTLQDALRHTQEKMVFQLERLRGKLSRAAFDRSEILRRHEQELLRFLMPEGHLQERQVSGIYFLGRAGYELLDELFGQVQPNCSNHQFVVY